MRADKHKHEQKHHTAANAFEARITKVGHIGGERMRGYRKGRDKPERDTHVRYQHNRVVCAILFCEEEHARCVQPGITDAIVLQYCIV